MKKGPNLGVILKQEYPPMIDGTSRDGHPIQYHASNWGHYSQIQRDDGQTPADRVKAEFWEKKYGPEAATMINTYCCMKSGLKNCDSNGKSGPVSSEVAKKRVAEYNQALQHKYPGNWQEQGFDAQVMYESSGGVPHGRLAIGDGALKKADIINAAKASNIRPANSCSHQNLMRMYQEEVATSQNLARRLVRAEGLIEILCRKIDIEIPDMDDPNENNTIRPGDGISNTSANMDTRSDSH